VDEALMRFTDLVLCFPPIILALAIAAALGIGSTNTILAMLVVWWPKFARLARALALVQRSQEYVEAATVLGLKPAASWAATSCPTRSARWPCWSRWISATPS
jgi:peptide/nickel transport system permease protein